jgi:hypothetical protein
LAEVRGIGAYIGVNGHRFVTAWVRVRAAFGYSVFIRETTSVVRAAWFFYLPTESPTSLRLEGAPWAY